MSSPRPKCHIFYLLLAILALPFGVLIGIYTIGLGYSMSAGNAETVYWSGIFAVFGAMIIFVLSAVMAGLWALIYGRTKGRAVGTLLWIGIFAVILVGVNFAVFNGHIVAHLEVRLNGSVLTHSYIQSIRYTFAQEAGWTFLLLLWPIIPIALFEAKWRKDWQLNAATQKRSFR